MSSANGKRGSAFGDVLKSLTQSLKPASGRVPVVVNAKVVGGGSDMQKLLQQLRSGSISTRVAAASEVCQSLQKFSISSVPEVWYLVRDLCDGRHPSSVRIVALEVMVQCILRDEDNVSSRLMYYRDILKFCNMSENRLDPQFIHFFNALVILSNDGRDILDLCIYNQERNWFEFISLIIKTLSRYFKNDAGKSLNEAPEYYEVFHRVCQYLKQCFKYNFSLLEEQFVSLILDGMYTISFSIDANSILESIGELVEIISVFGFIPRRSYVPTIQLFCWFASVSPELHDIAWQAMSRLYSVSPFNAMDGIVSVLQDPKLQVLKGRNVDYFELKQEPPYRVLLTALGALTMLEQCLLSSSSDFLENVNFSYDKLYWSITDCLSLDLILINSGILRIFDHLFSGLEAGTSATKKFMKLFPFDVWYSPSDSIFNLLSKLRLNTDQDKSYWTAICSSLHERFISHELVAPEERLNELFLLHPHQLEEPIIMSILEHYRSERLCTNMSSRGHENCFEILNAFYFTKSSSKLSQNIRISVLQLIKDSYEASSIFSGNEEVPIDCVLQVLKASWAEEDEYVVKYIFSTFLFDILQCSSLNVLKASLSVFTSVLTSSTSSGKPQTRNSLNSLTISSPSYKVATISSSKDTQFNLDNNQGQVLKELAKTLCKAFITFSTTNASASGELYNFLIEMAKFALKAGQHGTALIIFRGFIRIRSTDLGQIYFAEPADMEGLATTLHRNKSEESSNLELNRGWSYPESPEYLPSAYFNKPSRSLCIPKIKEAFPSTKAEFELDITMWLDIVIKVLGEYYHWELYSYMWAHFCPQLSNMSLFWNSRGHISQIQRIICESISLNLPEMLKFPISHTSVNKSDLQAVYVRNLSALIGYHNHFTRAEEDSIVNALLVGLEAWQKTAIPCIHMLTICCYEIPESLKKYLNPILTKLQAGVTDVYARSPTLEFLMALGNVPSMTSNFTIAEFKRVFAITFRYIEHASYSIQRGLNSDESRAKGTKDANDRASTEAKIQVHGLDAEVDKNPSTRSEVTPILYQYLLTVSYAVIARWFIKVDLNDRAEISSFIVRNIIACSGATDMSNIDDMTIAYLDLVSRFAFSDIPLKLETKPIDQPNRSRNRWLVGNSIVEISTDMYNGDSNIILRRPTSFHSLSVSFDTTSMWTADVEGEAKKPLVLSSHLLLQLFKPLDQGKISKPITLLDDAFTERAINSFDRIPVVAHQKAGIIYIAPGQNEEAKILANTVGSPDYHTFLDGIGQLIKLKSTGALYVGGLDRENGTDGEYAYFWGDELTQIIYHTTTLMPNSMNDKYFSSKKRHIGNNHVNVFFDESGLSFNFNVIRSQFNFLAIVVTPHTLKMGDCSQEHKFYKVKTYRRSGVPGIFSTTHFKIISLEQLPDLVRNLVIIANRFSDIWHNSEGGTYVTNWQMRVAQIKKLREKTIESHKQINQETVKKDVKPESSSSKLTTQSFLEQLQANPQDETNPGPEQANIDKGHDLYTQLEFSSYT